LVPVCSRQRRYSHSRLRQLILGGVTRHVLEHATLPVMMNR
jgi:nucleotide-binding universal stress UspA family protein